MVRLTFALCTHPQSSPWGHVRQYEDCRELSSIASEPDSDRSAPVRDAADLEGSGDLRDTPVDGRAIGTGLAARAWLVCGVFLLAIGVVLGIAAAGDRAFAPELDAMIAIQRLHWPWLDTLAWAASRAGDAWPGLLLFSLSAAAICWFRGRRDLAVFILLATAFRALGPPLKWLFASPRPPAEAITIFEHADGFGYPSGHAFGAALVFGALAIALPPLVSNRLLAWMIRSLAIAMIVLVALSRVRLGVHWPSDVVGGVVFGLGLICLLQAVMPRVRPLLFRT